MTSTTIQHFCDHPNHDMGEWYDATRFYDLKTIKYINSITNLPTIFCSGAGKVNHGKCLYTYL